MLVEFTKEELQDLRELTQFVRRVDPPAVLLVKALDALACYQEAERGGTPSFTAAEKRAILELASQIPTRIPCGRGLAVLEPRLLLKVLNALARHERAAELAAANTNEEPVRHGALR